MNEIPHVVFNCAQEEADDITFATSFPDAVRIEMDLVGVGGFPSVILNRVDATALRDWLNEVLA
jgi:hypothetical protein